MADEETTKVNHIKDIHQRVWQIRHEFWRQWVSPRADVDDAIVEELTAVALSYRDALIDFRDDSNLNPGWEDRDLDWIAKLAEETEEVVTTAAGRTNAPSETKAVPKVTNADPKEIYQFTKRLDQVAHELGFLDEPSSSKRPRSKIPVES